LDKIKTAVPRHQEDPNGLLPFSCCFRILSLWRRVLSDFYLLFKRIKIFSNFLGLGAIQTYTSTHQRCQEFHETETLTKLLYCSEATIFIVGRCCWPYTQLLSAVQPEALIRCNFKYEQSQVLTPDSHVTIGASQQAQDAANVLWVEYIGAIIDMRLDQRSLWFAETHCVKLRRHQHEIWLGE